MHTSQAALRKAVAAVKTSSRFSRQAIQARLASASAVLASANEPAAPIAPDDDRKYNTASGSYPVAV